MKNILISIVFILMLLSCSNQKNLVYFTDVKNNNWSKVDYSMFNEKIENGDILKIDIRTIIAEAAIPYNKVTTGNSLTSIDLLKLAGYLVNEENMINLPILGGVSVLNLNENDLAKKIKQLLVEGGYLTNPFVKVRKINSKFTVLGEVRSPGTFSYYDKNLTIFQALGYAGDLTITGKRNDITLIREENGLRKSFKISLSKSNLLDQPYYIIKNNDVIIVEPNFSKVKSAGFIGSSQSIASIASLLLSVTLLIINK